MALRSYELNKNKMVTKSASGEILDQTTTDNWVFTDPKVEQETVAIEVEQKKSPISPTAASQALVNEILEGTIRQNEFEKPTEYDPKDLEVLPKPSSDYRSLFDPVPVFKLSIEEQLTLKQKQLLPVFDTALMQANSNRRFATYEPDSQLDRYYEGIDESLKYTKDKIAEDECMGNDLYALLEELQSKGIEIMNVFTDEANTVDNNYARAYHEGLTAGYINAAQMIKDKLTIEEQWRFKATFKPTVGGN